MNSKLIFSTFGAILLASSILGTASAQGRHGTPGPGMGMNGNQAPIQHPAPVLSEVTGTVTVVRLDENYHQHQVSIDLSVGSKIYTILVGPAFYLEEKGFTIEKTNTLTVTLFPDFRNTNLWAAAGITNKTTNKTITLRDAAGYPLWMPAGMGGTGHYHGQDRFGQEGMRHQSGSCLDGQGLDLTKMVTLSGTVETIHLEYGKGPQSLTVKVGNNLVDVVLGPYWWLQEKGFQTVKGASLQVIAVPHLNSTSNYAALQVIYNNGKDKLILRDDQGLPLWFNRN